MTTVTQEKSMELIGLERQIIDYGKEFIGEMIDMLVICQNNLSAISQYDLRKTLLKYKIIKPSTKTITSRAYKSHNGDNTTLYIRNGRYQNIFSIRLKHSELPEVMQMLNN